MSKNLINKSLRLPSGLLVATFSGWIAMTGCTTDRHLGNGDPVTTPGVRTSPTSGVGGSESAPTAPSNPPMMSSSGIAPRSAPRPMSAAEAAAMMVDNLPPVRILGPSSPGTAERGYVSEGIETGQFIEPDPASALDVNVTTEAFVPVTGLAALAENVVVPQLVERVPPMLPNTTLDAGTGVTVPRATNGDIRTLAPRAGAATPAGSRSSVAATAVDRSGRTLLTPTGASGDVRVMRTVDGRVVVTNARSQ